MMESITKIIEFLPPLIKALPLTFLLTATAGVIGLILGTLSALALLSKSRLLKWPAFSYTFIFRGTPLLVQLYLIYYGLGQILPGTWVRHSFLWPYMRDGLWYAVFALSLNQGAYNAEVIRGAIKSIPRGQIEAALSIGMSRFKILRRITLPLAFRHCMPVLTSDLIILLKSTSLASTITIMEVMGTARALQRSSLSIFEPLIAAGIIYFTVVFILTRIMNVVERRMSGSRASMV